jgi:hypothetical protein
VAADGYEVRLIYRLSSRESELLTTDQHPDLVAMVNKVKQEHNSHQRRTLCADGRQRLPQRA